jgi:hypothetical protein
MPMDIRDCPQIIPEIGPQHTLETMSEQRLAVDGGNTRAAARPAPQRYLAHAPAALGSFLARSQMHLCPDSHRYMFTARAKG